MATRRSPRAVPRSLTPAEHAMWEEYYFIVVRTTEYFAKRLPRGLAKDEVLSEGGEALALAVMKADPSNKGLESYLWKRVKGADKSLVRKHKKAAGRMESREATTERLLERASAALDDYAGELRDHGDAFAVTREDSAAQFSAAL